MPAKKYRVKLTLKERDDLKELTSQGKAAARKLVHAQYYSIPMNHQKQAH